MAGENIEESGNSRIMMLLGQKYYRSDLAAEILNMHKNTLLQKAREGKIKKFFHNRSVWFKEAWLIGYLEKASA